MITVDDVYSLWASSQMPGSSGCMAAPIPLTESTLHTRGKTSDGV